ncbi:hypothetical protein CDAR_234081 [Caerostris darwini]|uniref:Uncharacterized protein n=1 Tax=Caerostris darwini TaxID=1538125 RepID=A0AAV4QJL5_9ARAC|nr:hypothetical protein CDAR_234081 [Caerostris darwini]
MQLRLKQNGGGAVHAGVDRDGNHYYQDDCPRSLSIYWNSSPSLSKLSLIHCSKNSYLTKFPYLLELRWSLCHHLLLLPVTIRYWLYNARNFTLHFVSCVVLQGALGRESECGQIRRSEFSSLKRKGENQISVAAAAKQGDKMKIFSTFQKLITRNLERSQPRQKFLHHQSFSRYSPVVKLISKLLDLFCGTG